jgi:hypothetical protein
VLLVDRATRSLTSYVVGCITAALALGLFVATKGILEQGSGGISITEALAVLLMISLTAILPILLFAWPAWLLVIAFRLWWGQVGLTHHALVWGIVAIVVMLILEGIGGHLVGPSARQPSALLLFIAVAGAIGGIVSGYLDRDALREHEAGTGDGPAQP